jgi:uncharacterized protein YrrD
MKKSADVLDLTVITLAEGKKVGKVREVVIDTDKRTVAGFLVQSGDWFKINGLPFTAVTSIGDDAIIIQNAESVIDASQMDQMESLLSKHVPLKDCTIFSKAGRVIGTVTEVLFDTDSGNLISLQIQSPDGAATEDVPIDAVVTFGQNILIVDEAKKKRAKAKVEEILEEAPAAVEEPVSIEEPQSQIEEETTTEELPAEEEVPVEEISAEEVRLEEEQSEEEIDHEAVEELTDSVESTLEAEPEIESAKPEEVAQEAEEGEALGDLFAKRQVQLLKGKILSRDIVAEDGRLIGSSGQEVDDNIIKEAINNKKLVELMVSVQSKD